jgi:hypothetical protein
MSTSARGHGLILRVQQLEAELPLLEKQSCHRDYLYVASNKGRCRTERNFPAKLSSITTDAVWFELFTGIEWHADPSLDHGVVTRGDTPRFIMESIKQCCGPPKLFMLDKYDEIYLLSCSYRGWCSFIWIMNDGYGFLWWQVWYRRQGSVLEEIHWPVLLQDGFGVFQRTAGRNSKGKETS